MPESVFAKYEPKHYPYRFTLTMHVGCIAGGTPADPNVAEGWLKTKLAPSDDLLRQMVAEVMVDRGVTADEAVEQVKNLKHLNGFKRDDLGLYIEGRQLKACIKEAASVAANAGNLPAKKWGNPDDANYRKGIKAWVPEHIFVVEDRLHLGVNEPTGIAQRFVHTHRGAGIQYEEYVEDAKITATVETDFDFPEAQWAAIWLTAERQGIGASRSQGYGTFKVVQWDRL